jgi:hypothetical protein
MKQDVLEPGGTYYIFNRGNNKEDIFREAVNYDYFLQLLKKIYHPHSRCVRILSLKESFSFFVAN